MLPLRQLGKKLSLSARLAGISAAIGVIVVALAATLGYLALSRQLDSRALLDLQGKRQLIRHVLAEIGSADQVPENGHRFGDLLIGHDDLHLAIADDRKGTLLASFSRLAIESIKCCANKTDAGAVTNWHSEDGESFTSLADAWTVASGDTLRFVLSQNRINDIRLLQGYMKAAFIGMPLLLGLVLAGAWVVARTGLAPLAVFKKLARESSPVSLSQRLVADDMPVELRDLAVDFNAMLERIDAGITQLNQFSGDLAHEMRTPVGILLGRTQVSLSRPRTADQLVAVLEANVEDLERLSRLIDDMLFLARAENEAEELSFVPLLVQQEARTVADFIEVIAAERGIAIDIDGDATVHANKFLLQRAITNLLTNAIRHAAANSTVRIEVARTTKAIELAVENIGAPIPAKDMGRLFDRFYRVDEGRARHAGGAGLGLSIVKTIMRLHGGDVDVTSTLANGIPGVTRFTLRFPDPVSPAGVVGNGSAIETWPLKPGKGI